MDLRFSEEQELLRSSADSFLRDRPRQRPSAAAADAAERDTWAAVAEMGWLGLPVPEEFDGLGLGHVELSIVAEALGRHLVTIPYVPSVVLATSLLKALGTGIVGGLRAFAVVPPRDAATPATTIVEPAAPAAGVAAFDAAWLDAAPGYAACVAWTRA